MLWEWIDHSLEGIAVGRGSTPAWRTWRHIVNLDPDRPIADEVLVAVGESGTDCIYIGGTQGVTHDNANALLGRLRRFAPHLPLWQEISEETAVVDGVDGYAIPVVLNAGSPEWLIGAHARAIAKFRPFLDWSKVLVEGYLVLNEAAAVAQRTGARTGLEREEAASYAVAGERLFSLPVIYLEYSGTYGDPALVAAVARHLSQAQLFYGGGIHSAAQAGEMGRHADTIVVGNALYDPDWRNVLEETIHAAKNA